jgi:predicted enzyme related to lactoylglutathione lyase
MAEILWKDVKPNWVPYIVVENVEEIVTKAKKLGGRLLLGLQKGASKDSVAILPDPAGGIFGVQQIWKLEKVQP